MDVKIVALNVHLSFYSYYNKNIDEEGNRRDIIVTGLVSDPIQDIQFCEKQYQDSTFGLAQIWFNSYRSQSNPHN